MHFARLLASLPYVAYRLAQTLWEKCDRLSLCQRHFSEILFSPEFWIHQVLAHWVAIFKLFLMGSVFPTMYYHIIGSSSIQLIYSLRYWINIILSRIFTNTLTHQTSTESDLKLFWVIGLYVKNGVVMWHLTRLPAF